MKKYGFLAFVGLFFLSMTGCYESKVPLSSTPTLNIDTKLVNYWISIPKEKNDDEIKLAIFKFNEMEYFISWKEGANQETIMARGFISDIENVRILNIQDIKSIDNNDRTYLFFNYIIDEKGILTAKILSNENPLLKNKKFNTPEEFQSFIKKNIKNKELFSDPIEFKPTDKFDIEIKQAMTK
jgi:hypothetical protein